MTSVYMDPVTGEIIPPEPIDLGNGYEAHATVDIYNGKVNVRKICIYWKNMDGKKILHNPTGPAVYEQKEGSDGKRFTATEHYFMGKNLVKEVHAAFVEDFRESMAQKEINKEISGEAAGFVLKALTGPQAKLKWAEFQAKEAAKEKEKQDPAVSPAKPAREERRPFQPAADHGYSQPSSKMKAPAPRIG